jgi:hypothetical protein
MFKEMLPMNLGKESKMLEQGIITWLIFAVVVLIIWAAIFASFVYVLKYITESVMWLRAAFAATVAATGFVLAAKKFLRK